MFTRLMALLFSTTTVISNTSSDYYIGFDTMNRKQLCEYIKFAKTNIHNLTATNFADQIPIFESQIIYVNKLIESKGIKKCLD